MKIPASVIKQKAEQLSPQLIEVRRHLHRFPELSFREFQTSAFLQEKLRSAGIIFSSGHAGTGIVATVEGKAGPGHTVLLRGDMDALPITEKNTHDHISRNEGVMHACGHDVHSTCALGAALILQTLRDQFAGTVRIMFQPGEEVLPGGASLMIAEGVLENPKVEKAIALHVSPELEAGTLGFRPGMYMASTDEIYVTIIGKGGHAAMPASYNNPLLASAEFLLAVQQRFMEKDALKGTQGESIPTVVAFGKALADGATNVIPDKVELAGTVRTMDESWRAQVHRMLQEMAASISTQREVQIQLEIRKGYPVLYNNEALTERCMLHAAEYLEAGAIQNLGLRMTAEDFAYVTQKVPSCFFRLGTGNRQEGITAGVHSANFDVDESAIALGAGMLAWLALSETGN